MSGAAAAAGVSGYYGDKASRAQQKAAKRALQEQKRQFELIREDTKPYREAGAESIGILRNMLIEGDYDFERMPGAQFRMEQGQEGVENYMNRLGMRRSGRGIKEIERYRQDVASEEIGNYMNRLFSVIGSGQGGVNTSASAGMQTAANVGNIQMQSGRDIAEGYANINRSIQGGMRNYFTNQQNQRMMDRIGGNDTTEQADFYGTDR